jgi:hypothetical protein
MASLAFDFLTPAIWEHVPIEDPRVRELADRHYSRQTIGAKGFVPGGRRFCLLHIGEPAHKKALGRAGWAVCYNMDPTGVYQWRNTLFRNETKTLSSELVIAATAVTFDMWRRRYGELPVEDLITEIDIVATSRRRSKKSVPGKCYQDAGWIHVRDVEPGHGRSAKSIWRAPR